MRIVIDDAAGTVKYIWDYLDIIVIGGKMETVEANTRAANKGVSTMTQFKEGDEVLVKAKFLYGREDAVLTFDYEIDGYFAPCVKDLIPASALDVNKELLAENEQLRNAIKVQANAVRVLHEAETSELNRLRKNAQEAYTAKATLDSEREANKILTDEIERLRKALRLAGDRVEPLASFQQKDIGSSTIRVGEETKLSRDARSFNGEK